MRLLTILFTALALNAYAIPKESELFAWQKKNFGEVKKSIEVLVSKQFTTTEGPISLTIENEPDQIIPQDDNNNTAIVRGTMTQGGVKLFTLFYVMQQVKPYQANAVLLYTCNDEKHMPSALLYLDIMQHPYMVTKHLPGGFSVYINTLDVQSNGMYRQEWTLYNAKGMNRVQIVCSPDGVGGTNFAFINS